MSTTVLYANRPEWSDVTPIPQHDPSTSPVAPIFYSETYKDATDYFRGIVKAGEHSERVLELTESIIRMNPAHYSAWQYRYKTLLAIKAPLEKELGLMDEIATKYLKTYQVWHHRRLLLTALKKPGPELQFIEAGLREDAKNYHTWAYRQWVLAHFNDDHLWEGELAFVERLLEEDVRNNSAWHHRFFVVFSSGVRTGDEDREAVVRRELSFTKEKIAIAPNNASAWNYLRGVLATSNTPYESLLDFVLPYSEPHRSTLESTEGGEDVVDLENPPPSQGADLPSPYAVEFLADIYEAKAGSELEKAIKLWRSLADELDTIRKNYWEYRIHESHRAA